jgi:hypothetical protein
LLPIINVQRSTNKALSSQRIVWLNSQRSQTLA